MKNPLAVANLVVRMCRTIIVRHLTMAATNLVAAFVRRQMKQIQLTEANSAGSRRRLRKTERRPFLTAVSSS